MSDDYITMRQPCESCSEFVGYVEERNGQDVVYCGSCGTYTYNRPRSESGREVRSVRSRPRIKPSQRARILERDNATCVVCHRADGPMDIGHLLSVADGRKLGATDAELFHDENLGAMCRECNLGQGARTISLRLVYRILQARITWTEGADDAVA